MANKNGEGLWYLKDKIIGSSNNSNNSCYNGNYSSRGSDDYYNSYENLYCNHFSKNSFEFIIKI